MDSFTGSTEGPYRANTNRMVDPDTEDDSEFSGILEIYVHHARNIHNICIYDNQDVYAKFSLTCNPDEALSTSIILGGGKNPEFNESLAMKVTQLDGVLKCEMWMLSRARNYMEDQLLGFALVPISQLVGKGKVTQDYSLSSTDLFHSPAGTVKLTLSINTPSLPANPVSGLANSSISSEVVLLDRRVSEAGPDPVEYSRIEFPDISVVSENHKMLFEYFSVPRSFLHLGASPRPVPVIDCEMNTSSCEENQPVSSCSPSGSIQTSGFLSSTTTSRSDDRVPSGSTEKTTSHISPISSNPLDVSITRDGAPLSSTCPDTPTSRKSSEVCERDANFSGNEEETSKETNTNPVKFSSQVFSAPLGSIIGEADQAVMQQQIVDMYMKSMHQFTESLAKMKLPMDLANPETDNPGDLIQVQGNNNVDGDKKKKKKDGSRVFYGSRAFF